MSDNYLKISIDGHLSDAQKSVLAESGVAVSTSNSLFGGELTTEILAVISAPYVLSHLKDIIIELIKNRRKVIVKTKDFEFNDVSMAQIFMLLERLQTNTNNANPIIVRPPEKAAAKRRQKNS